MSASGPVSPSKNARIDVTHGHNAPVAEIDGRTEPLEMSWESVEDFLCSCSHRLIKCECSGALGLSLVERDAQENGEAR